jgi:hypothetical protein
MLRSLYLRQLPRKRWPRGLRALNVLEGSAVPSDQFWDRLNKSCELHSAVMHSLNACIRTWVGYNDEAPPIPPQEPVQEWRGPCLR